MQSSINTPEEARLIRQSLRRQAIAAREQVPAAEHDRLSALIAAHVGSWLAGKTPAVLGFCWPYRAEFDARPLATQCLQQGWQLCLPVVGEEFAPMQFRAWTPATPMYADRHGIQTPQSGALLQPDILLLPFNAIDAQGYRLGYGAGYFDRTLASMQPRPYVLGVGFSLGLLPTVHPQPHDIPVNCVITELGVLKPA